jgi:thiamine pyridinylase
VLRVALYPYVPERAELYWQVESAFEEANPQVNVQFVDLAANYYGGELQEAIEKKLVDVVEVDTVFLHDLVANKLVERLPPDLQAGGEYLPVAQRAACVGGVPYGVPHWVCGNFLFFRRDDPEYARFAAVKSTRDLERIIGRPSSDGGTMLIDLRGKSTLGEKYLDALLDLHGTPQAALKIVDSGAIDPDALQALARAFALCPNGLCDSEKHHESGQFYARQFAERNARAFVGYSERMYFIVDHFLHGVREDMPAVGQISFESGAPVGIGDVDAVPATFGDKSSTMLTWVDVLCIRQGVDDAQRRDCVAFIKFVDSHGLTTQALLPPYGHAPRYLLPARTAVYQDASLLKAAPLYQRFEEVMKSGVAITGPQLNERLRDVGKKIETGGFDPGGG